MSKLNLAKQILAMTKGERKVFIKRVAEQTKHGTIYDNSHDYLIDVDRFCKMDDKTLNEVIKTYEQFSPKAKLIRSMEQYRHYCRQTIKLARENEQYKPFVKSTFEYYRYWQKRVSEA